MGAPKKHYLVIHPFDIHEYALCGNERAWHFVEDIKDVTCKLCQNKWLRRH